MPRKTPIFYSALMLTGVNLLLRLVSTSFQVYLSGRIGPAGIGLLQMVLSVGSLAMTAGIAGIRTATMYLTAGELGRSRPENVRWVLSGCITYSILCSGLLAAGICCFAREIATFWIGDIRTVEAIRLFGAFLPVSCLCAVMTGYFTAAGRILVLAAVEVAEQFCTMAITLVLLTRWAGADAARACQAVVLGSGIGGCATVLGLLTLRVKERAPAGPRIPVWPRLLKTAVPLAIADDLKAGISTTENLMVPRRLAKNPTILAPMASFGMICGMVFPVLMFPAAILFGLAELLIPELARCAAAGSQKRIGYLVRRSLRVALLYGCFCSGLLVLLAPELCTALYGNPEAGAHLRLYGLLAPMLYCDAITDAMIKGLGQQTASVRYNILTSTMDVVLLFLLLPKYGLEGYFVSFLVTHFLNFLLSLRRLLRISIKRISWRVAVLTVAATGISVAAASFLQAVTAKVVAFVLVMGSLLYLFRVFGKEDILWLRGLIDKKRKSTPLP